MSDISLAYVGYTEKTRNNKKHMENRIARQCHYYSNFLVKSEKKMKEHLSCCAGKAGFTFSFDNEKVIDYQDHYNNLGDMPFSLYFDFETTTGNVDFLCKDVCSLIVYSIIVAFHPDLSLPWINIFRSYEQSYSSLMSLGHFFVLEFKFFDDPEIFNKNTLKQLEAAALSVNQQEKILL